MIKNAKSKVLLIDSSKFNKRFMLTTCELKDIDYIITDKKPSDEIIEQVVTIFRELRNKCAHNEKIFDFEFNDVRIDEIVSMELLRKGFKLPENIKLINTIIYLKYFLDDIDYKIFINRLLTELKRLYDKINKKSFYTVLSDLGINSSEMLKIIKNVKIKKSYNF